MRQAPLRGASLAAATTGVSADQHGGGWEIRTPEGLPPTRFPSVRPRPLGESSAGQPTGLPGRPRARPPIADPGASCPWGWLDWPQTPRTAFIPPTPPGPEGSKGTRTLTGVRGVPPVLVRMRSWQATSPVRPERARRSAALRPRRRLCTGGTARLPLPTSGGKTTSPSRCARRYAAGGCITPTCSAGRAGAARRQAPGSWPARSTASRGRPPTRAGSAPRAWHWPRPGRAAST